MHLAIFLELWVLLSIGPTHPCQSKVLKAIYHISLPISHFPFGDKTKSYFWLHRVFVWMVIFWPSTLWLPWDRGRFEAKCIWATGVLFWQPGMSLVCVGGSLFKRPQAGIFKPGCLMNWCYETTKKGVPPDNRRVLVPSRTWMVRRRGRHPRTHGRTAISVVLVSDSSNIQAKCEYASLSRNSPCPIHVLHHLIQANHGLS